MSYFKQLGSAVMHASGLNTLSQFHTRIIAFHQVNPEHFEAQMKHLKKHFRVVSLKKAVKNLDAQQVVLTFDDGYKNNHLHAYPVLKKLGLPATLFVTTDFIDNNTFTWWDRLQHLSKPLGKLKSVSQSQREAHVKKVTGLGPGSQKPSEFDFCSWQDLRKMTDVFDIGSHTISHPILPLSTLSKARKEIVESKKKIERMLKKKVVSFAYPNGSWNKAIAAEVEKAGYQCAVLYKKGNNTSSTDLFKLFRRGINKKDNLAVFATKLAGVF